MFNSKILFRIQVLTFACVCLGSTACSSLSELDQLTALSTKKQQLLHERVGKFGKALYWGALANASKYVTPETRLEFLNKAQQRKKTESLVDVELVNIELHDDTGDATVTMELKYYSEPSLYVKTRTEEHFWEYRRFSGGWYHKGQKDIEVSDAGGFGSKGSARIGRAFLE